MEDEERFDGPIDAAEVAEGLTRALEDREDESRHRRLKALKELEAAAKAGIATPHASYIVGEYPDFDHITLKVEVPGKYRLTLSVAEECLEEHPELVDEFAAEVAGWWTGVGGADE